MQGLKIEDIAIFVCTCKKNKDRANTIKETWAKRVPDIHYMTDEDTNELPNAVNLGPINYNQLSLKSWEIWKFAYKKYNNKKKWFLKIDDDSYLFLNNLVKTLSKYDYTKPWYMGDYDDWKKKIRFKPDEILAYEQTFGERLGDGYWIGGGSGIVLSQDSLKQLVHSKNIIKIVTSGEDIWLAICLKRINIYPTHLEGFYHYPDIIDFMDFGNLISVSTLNSSRIRLIDKVKNRISFYFTYYRKPAIKWLWKNVKPIVWSAFKGIKKIKVSLKQIIKRIP